MRCASPVQCRCSCEGRSPLADYVPLRDGHLLVLGDAGSGKTELLGAIATSALERGELVLFADAIEAAATVNSVAKEVQRRYDIFNEAGVDLLADLPVPVRPKPLLVLVDGADALLGFAPAESSFRWSLADVLGRGSGVDVHLAMSLQVIENVAGYELMIGQFGTLTRLESSTHP